MSDNLDRFWSDSHSPHIAVIGVGNILLKDEGIGIHVIQALNEISDSDHNKFMVIDGGTCPDVFCCLPEKIELMIIVDAVKGGGRPGSIYRFSPYDIEFRASCFTSIHQLGLDQDLKMMAKVMEMPKEVVIIGIEPKETGWGLAISLELEEKIPFIIELIMNEIGNYYQQKLT